MCHSASQGSHAAGNRRRLCQWTVNPLFGRTNWFLGPADSAPGGGTAWRAGPGFGRNIMPIYHKIRPKRVSEQVFEHLREVIFRGQLKPGVKLMPERELAEALGVSRPPSGAINKLVDRGSWSTARGRGPSSPPRKAAWSTTPSAR